MSHPTRWERHRQIVCICMTNEQVVNSLFYSRKNLERFKTGEVRFLICTDVAARGIDIKELPYVISESLRASQLPHKLTPLLFI